jgi:hypothetical protein
MAKKKTAPKKTPRSLSPLTAQVLAECAFATGQGMEKEMAVDGRPYVVHSQARDYWLKVHTISIHFALKRKTANWRKDRQGVLPMANFLGRRAAQLALADAGTASPVSILKKHVTDASAEVKIDPRCTAGKGGGGVYCEV